jgi:hypothetical protein
MDKLNGDSMRQPAENLASTSIGGRTDTTGGDTPRTDAETINVYGLVPPFKEQRVTASFARQLERELADTTVLDSYVAENQRFADRIEQLEERIEQLYRAIVNSGCRFSLAPDATLLSFHNTRAEKAEMEGKMMKEGG